MPGRRVQQVADLLRGELASLIQGLRDPGLGFVTVTEVRLSPDLREAQVFVSVLNGPPQASIDALGRATGWLRRELAHRAYLKQVPRLSFRIDDSMRRGARIESLLSGSGRSDGEEE